MLRVYHRNMELGVFSLTAVTKSQSDIVILNENVVV